MLAFGFSNNKIATKVLRNRGLQINSFKCQILRSLPKNLQQKNQISISHIWDFITAMLKK